MNYNLDGICQECIYLEKIKPLFEEKDKEIERLNHECDTYMKIATNKQKLLDFEIERNDIKQDKIDKALVFIDKYCIDDEFYINLSYKEKAIIEVKKILQGDDNK